MRDLLNEMKQSICGNVYIRNMRRRGRAGGASMWVPTSSSLSFDIFRMYFVSERDIHLNEEREKESK